MPLRYAIHVPTFAEPDVLVELAVTAEGQGWDGFLLWDHILGSREMRFPIVDGLLSGEPVHHAGVHYRVDGAVFLPRPVQRPRVPIWVACSWPNRRPLARAARWDGVIMLQMRDDQLVAIGSDEVTEVAAQIRHLRTARNPYDIAVVLPGLPHDPAGLEEAGATWVLVTGWLDDLPRIIAAGPPI